MVVGELNKILRNFCSSNSSVNSFTNLVSLFLFRYVYKFTTFHSFVHPFVLSTPSKHCFLSFVEIQFGILITRKKLCIKKLFVNIMSFIYMKIFRLCPSYEALNECALHHNYFFNVCFKIWIMDKRFSICSS